MDKIFGSVVVLVIISVLAMASALAVVPNGAQVGTSGNNGRFPVPDAGNITVVSGNITMASLEANMSTSRWAGLYGNATGVLNLGDSSSNVMYSWDAVGNIVYASIASPTWASLADANAANVTAAFAFINGALADNYTNTFTGAPESIGSGIFSLSSDYATTRSGGATVWKTYSLTDGTNIVFTGKVSNNGVAYNNQDADYQMIIPEDGTGGDETATAWKLYLELV
jgi:hypothetical protein